MGRRNQFVGWTKPQDRRGRRVGFTLTELISTTAVMTLLLAITVPVLTRNREGERTAACLTNLKLLGQAISLYVADNQGSLPGPTTVAIPWNAAGYLLPLETQSGGAMHWYSVQLAHYLGPYVDRGTSGGTPADVLPFCPSADGIAVASNPSAPLPMVRLKYYYLLNTVGWGAGYATSGEFPYYRTKYGSYFGYTYVPTTCDIISQLPPERLPRKLETIPNLATEWAIADIWYWEGTYFPRGRAGLLGTWPYERTVAVSSTVMYAGKLRVPSYPFHGTTKSYSSDVIGSPDRRADSPRLTTGKTNAVYLDGHAASVRNWQGTANPCFAAEPGVCN